MLRALLPVLLLACGANEGGASAGSGGVTAGGAAGSVGVQVVAGSAGQGGVASGVAGAAGAAGAGGVAGTSGGSAGISAGGEAAAGQGGTNQGGAGGEASTTVWECTDCPEPPATLNDWINGHGDTLTLHGFDGNVAVYIGDTVDTDVIGWILPFTSAAFAYMKEHYDTGCHYGDDRLYVFIHQDMHGGGTISSYFDSFSTFRNAVDMGANTWERSLQNINIDLISHEMGHIVEGSSNCIHESPGFGVWGDSKWAEIFQYDLYMGLGMEDDADKLYDRFMNGQDTWFPMFYYPMYQQYGGVAVLDGFFKLIAEYFPRQPENGGANDVYSRRMNLGELVHFYSGAAGADVSSLAQDAFGDEFLPQLAQAKLDFPEITY